VKALQRFRAGDIITIYMGRQYEEQDDPTYTLKKVNACDHDDVPSHPYFLAHLIQHLNEDDANTASYGDYMIVATRDIEIGDELFMDYRRPIYCKTCANPKSSSKKRELRIKRTIDSCSNGNCINTDIIRECGGCKKLLCKSCYDAFQISVHF
jgi:hypothetical protein